MSNDLVRGQDTSPLAEPGRTVEVNLDELEGKLHEGIDLVGYRLTGQARQIHDLSSHNFISCVFDHVFANEIDLTRCDFKDVLVKDSHFRRCLIEASTHSTSFYSNSIFEECDFTNGAHTGCEYRQVTFTACQLSNLLTKNSRLIDCTFDRCETKTHVFEGNVFLRTTFIQTNLELRTILSNFGIKRALTNGCKIRNERVSGTHSFVNEHQLRNVLEARATDPLASLSAIYFIDGNLLSGGKAVDTAFDIKSWISLTHQPTSFAQLVESLAEFLVNCFESDEVEVHKILLLHDVTREMLAESADDPIGHRTRLSFGGIHLALSRIVEMYLLLLADVLRSTPGMVHVLANGPPSVAHFEIALKDVLTHCGVSISEARPHNSPTELVFVELLPGGKFFLIALLLATFVRFELVAHSTGTRKQPIVSKPRKKRPSNDVTKRTEFFELTAGLSAEQQKAYELRLKALMPLTSLVVELKLAVSTQLIQKLRGVIIRILE